MGKKIIYSQKAPKPIGPYSQAVEMGNMIFLSGQIPVNPDAGDIKIQTRQVLDNIKAVLEDAGYKMDDIVKTTIYLTDIKQFSQVNEVYAEYFSKEPPARSTVEVKGLPKGVPIEIDAIAVR